jgi:hypothetical protein
VLNLKTAAVAATVALFSIPGVLAQPVPAPPLHPPNPRDCMPTPGDGDSFPGSSKENPRLSDQLSPSKGVICPPPGIDPDISVPPTGGGKTRVIPPPGTSGGDLIQPKL